MNIHTPWVEKYRPKSIDDCILSENNKRILKSFIEAGNFPSLLLYGGTGSGKTSSGRILCDELGYETMFINASDERNIDTIRGKVKNFAQTVSMFDKPKCVFLDEADGLSMHSQPALRSIIETYHETRFIFTCNYKDKIIAPLQSRLTAINFFIPTVERDDLMIEFYKSVINILKKEEVEFDKKVVARMIRKTFPNFRKTLIDLEKFSKSGKIESWALNDSGAAFDSDSLVKYLTDGNFKDTRQWVADHVDDIEVDSFFRFFYDHAYDFVAKESIPDLVLLIGEYQYKAAMVADHEINVMAFLTECMKSIEFKGE